MNCPTAKFPQNLSKNMEKFAVWRILILIIERGYLIATVLFVIPVIQPDDMAADCKFSIMNPDDIPPTCLSQSHLYLLVLLH